MKIHFGSKSYDIDALRQVSAFSTATDSVIAQGPGLTRRNEAFAFSSESELRRWIVKQPIGKQLAPLFKQLAKARTEAKGDLTSVKKKQLAKAARIDADLRQLAKQSGLKLGSKELFLRATRDASALEGAVFDPASVYTGANFTGNSIGAALPLPDLSWWPGMNNSITSAQVLGICVLFSRTLFRGRSLWLVGAPYMQVANLAGTGFNNAASSAYVYLY